MLLLLLLLLLNGDGSKNHLHLCGLRESMMEC
jgi:hypothetical protein